MSRPIHNQLSTILDKFFISTFLAFIGKPSNISERHH